jgi:glutamate--cysteine ligase
MGSNKEIIVGSIDPEIKDDFEINLESGSKFKVFKLKKNQNKLITSNGFEADLIILNNDLTDGIPDILKNITIPIIPSPNMGWHQRTKSNHFTIYNQFAIEVAKILEIDPWLISSFHQNCGNVDFKEQKGMQCIIDNVDKILKDLQNKYKQHSIKETPYCYVKADNGTYGMAIWSVNSPEEIISINKKERNKMNIIKGSTKNSKVIIQEGIPTTDKINDFPCEPLIYMINADIVENLFRANQNRDNKTSLNASGASFYNSYNIPLINNISENKEEYFLVYRFIARLSSLASSFELIPNPIFK